MRRLSNQRKGRPRLVPVEEIMEHLRQNRCQLMGPIDNGASWELLLLPEDAEPGTPPASIPLFPGEDGALWGEQGVVEGVLRSAMGPRRTRSGHHAAQHEELCLPEEALSWIQVLGNQGHIGTDPEADERWLCITRCVPNSAGEIVCTPIGTVPIEYGPDGQPGVSIRVLEEILGTRLPPAGWGSGQGR